LLRNVQRETVKRRTLRPEKGTYASPTKGSLSPALTRMLKGLEVVLKPTRQAVVIYS